MSTSCLPSSYRSGIAILLLSTILLSAGCGWLRPPSGMGAVFSEPEEALRDALEPGWLGTYEDVAFHESYISDGIFRTLFSGYPAGDGQLVIGFVDAKRRFNGWYAHGRYGPMVPPAAHGRKISCSISAIPIDEPHRGVVTGQIATSRITQLEVVLQSGTSIQAFIRDNSYGVLLPEGELLQELRGLDQQGDVIGSTPSENCS